MPAFHFIKSGPYLSDDIETVKREMTDIGSDINKFTMAYYETNYCPRNTHINENGLENILSNLVRPGQRDRIVFKCHYKINTEDLIKSNLEWEREYRLKELKNKTTTVLCAYPVDNIIPKLSDSTGVHAKLMSDLQSSVSTFVYV